MLEGKKSIAEKIVYYAIEHAAQEALQDSKVFFENIINSIMPTSQCKSRRFGGATYLVPVSIPESKRAGAVLRIIVKEARKIAAKGQPMNTVLKNLLSQTHKKEGAVISALDKLAAEVEANQAFAHFMR